MCLGAGLAPTELFLTSILLRFFLLPVGSHSDTDPNHAVHWPGQRAPSLPAPPRGPLKADSAQLTGSQNSLPSSVNKGLNCRWRTLFKKREQESQLYAALR